MSRLLITILILLTAILVKGLPFLQDEQTTPVWGDWSDWSTCSRTCGSGVSSQQRSCLANCKTEGHTEKRYQSCCIQECPLGSPDFREQQCKLQTELRDGNWTLAESDNDDCIVACRDRMSDSARPKILWIYVAEGTPCRTGYGEKGVCLGNQCAVIGCDGILGSGKTEDKCFQCRLDPGSSKSTCQIHSNTVVQPPLPFTGNVSVLNIPSYSTSLNISHPLVHNEGRLALKSASSEYVFQGGNNDTKFQASGITFVYRILQDGDGYREELTARGPLAQSLKVELHNVTKERTPEVAYTYHLLQDGEALPTDSANMTHVHSLIPTEDTSKVYRWRHMAQSECSASCGRGTQTLEPKCVDQEFPDRPLVDELCTYHGTVKPLPIVKLCNCQDCPPHWVSWSWSPCSEECGGGVQTRRVECRQMEEEGRPPVLLTNSSSCPAETRPPEVRQCNLQECCAAWVSGEWSQCSEEIYDGVQYRTVECQVSGLVVDSTHCSVSTKPATVQICRQANCVGAKCYGWRPREWRRKCSNACKQTRNVFCQVVNGKQKVNKTLCSGLDKPAEEQSCWDTRGINCNPFWQVGDYGQCCGECCGEQMQHRQVQCVVGGDTQSLSNEACSAVTKPAINRPCQRPDCPTWSLSEWGECSAECGSQGLQTRTVQCLKGGGDVLEPDQCCGPQPPEARPCLGGTCPTTPTPPICTVDKLPQYCMAYVEDSPGKCRRNFIQTLCCSTCARLTTI